MRSAVGILIVLLCLAAIGSSINPPNWCVGTVPDSHPWLSRWPYLNAVTESSAKISWGTIVSNGPTLNPYVRLYTESGNEILFRAESAELEGGIGVPSVLLFVAELQGLLPDTVYCYGVFNNGTEIAGGFALKTALPFGSNQTITFAAIGDFGAGTPGQRNIRDALKAYMPTSDLFLALGDNVYLTGTQREYNMFNFDVYKELWANIPLYLCIGNHDWYFDRAFTYLANYHQIYDPYVRQEDDIGRYFSWNWGRVHFVSIDTEDSLYDDADNPLSMFQWLAGDLQRNAQYPWKVVILHKPPYVGSRVANQEVVDKLIPVFEAYGVQVVFGGHHHLYEAYPPLRGNQVVPVAQGGVQYITSGGGGYPIFGELVADENGGWRHDPNMESPYNKDLRGPSAADPIESIRTHHFLVGEITDCQFTIKAINEDLEQIHQVIVDRCQ